jgi:glycosyltransferase involved in cell wall biosynthesis
MLLFSITRLSAPESSGLTIAPGDRARYPFILATDHHARRVAISFQGFSIGVVMPALNEEGVVGATLDSIPRDIVDVVWVADNGSTDGTAAEAAAHGACVVFEARRGYGAACLAALASMEQIGPPDVVAFIDADGSEPVDELPVVLEPIACGKADFVIGYRQFKDTAAHVSFGNRLACWIISTIAGYRFRDLGPFRAIRFDALKRLALKDRDYGWNVEMQARAVAEGLSITEVPVSHLPRPAGRSKISGSVLGTIRAGSKIIQTALREAWRARKPRKSRGKQGRP